MEKSIIIVEDDKQARDLLSDFFKLEKIDINIFPTADKALDYIKHNEVCIVISDIDMPGKINGLGLLKEVKKNWPEIAFISMSGNYQHLSEAKKLGANSIFPKPFYVDELIKNTKQLIAKAK